MPGLHQMLNTIYEADSASSTDGIRRGEPGLRFGHKTSATGAVDLSVPVSTILTSATPMDFQLVSHLSQRPDTAILNMKPTQQPLFQTLSQQHQQMEHKMRLSVEAACRNAEHARQESSLRQLVNKDKSKCSAMASPAVKQKLLEMIRNKQQVAPDRNNVTNHSSNTTMLYRPPEIETHQPPIVNNFIPQVTARSCNPSEHFPLRRTASEPNLKWPCRPKKSGRKNPLTRKESAPPAVRRRPLETQDSSPSSSSTPVSGCSSPNDSIPAENGSLSSIPGAASEGDIERRTLSGMVHVPLVTHPTVFMSSGIEGHDGTNSLAARLQPVIILESSGTRTPLVAVQSLGSVPFQISPSLLSNHSSVLGHHKALSRTRSEPIPQNQKTLQQQLLYQPQYPMYTEHLKQRQFNKRLSKTSERPRLSQIPSEELDDSGAASERPSEVGGNSLRGHGESLRGGLHDTHSSSHSVVQQQHYLPQTCGWDQSHHRNLQQLKRSAPLDTLMIPLQQGTHRPLSRAKSSPASASLPTPDPSSKTISLAVPEQATKPRFTTGIVYDSVMLKHQCTCGDNSNHPEHAGRIQSIWSRLQERGLRNHCEYIRGRKASLEELQSVHTETHVLLYGTNPLNRLKLDNRKLAGILAQRMFVMLPCGGLGVDSDTIWNELHSSNAARWAAGSVIDLSFKVVNRELKNGFALVRPPGHHADPSTAMGFCFFNSVAIAAKQLQQKLDVRKILIVDWDVHHGNGTQRVFYRDPNVLYISLHRHDDGNFFPGSGAADEVGAGNGEGFNVNVAWTGGLEPPMGDAEYLAAFRTLVMPIAHEFSPDVVLVSAGFDAAEGHPAPLGGYKVTAKCFGHMTRQLMSLAGGRVVLALEGGHDLTSICDASEACVSALLGNELDPLSEETLRQRPNPNAVRSLETCIQVQSKYWASVKRFASKVGYSFLEAKHDKDEVETVTALASLSVGRGSMAAAGNSVPHEEPMEEDTPMSL
ncbi:Hypothetical predicted protein [Pelobates cultripes]|uniref:Histone deacetylase n=1 Tax=Pelobates cultripes TaxID=61616 RepID=A0AAD1R684_PELCU|nr:Hypothetical predicted protein [Pelobates cultripes]